MTKYHVTNTGSVTRAYEADNGHKLTFTPGETKTVSSLPPNPGSWGITEQEAVSIDESNDTEQRQTPEDNEEGGEKD